MSGPRGRGFQGNRHIFRWPIWIGVATLVGLASALVGDGWYDALSWMLLGGLVVLVGRQLLR